MTIENDHVKLVVGTAGQILRVIDRGSGTELCTRPGATPFARVTKGGKETGSTGASYANGTLTLEFREAAVSVRLNAITRKSHFLFEVAAISDNTVDRLTFLDLPLSLKGTPRESVAGCVLALNLRTQVQGIPAATSRLRASCYPRFGFVGSKAAVIICPQEELRSVMQEVVSAAEELPHSPIGGPWALDGKENNGSYLFNTSDLSEETADEWIELARTLGITQIDFHGGTSFRFGDCRPNPTTYPRGTASMKAVLDRLHEAGILAGLHTYAMFIDKSCPWVTPVPDPRLGTDAIFTLGATLDANATDVPVEESTEAMSTITGFFVRNSVTLRIGNELITYAGLSKKPPYAFTQCTRGACGTAVATHQKGARVYHLRECFGRFVPDGDSTLFTEVAAKTAELYNDAGFDMIYLDALDGGDTVAGRENAWHYESKFTFEIWERLKRPAIMEMSTFHHHLWYVRSRMGAWDHPTRSHKTFIDIHCKANQGLRRQFLPGHLGWWAFKTWRDLDSEPTHEDDIEYLCSKAIANDTGLSIMGITPANVGKIPALPRLASIVRRHESLRHAGYFSEAMKDKLRVPGDEYALFQSDDGDWQFHPMAYDRHKVESREAWSSTWAVENSFKPQPPALRIEVLTAARSYDSGDSKLLADLGETGVLPQAAAQPGITATLEPSTVQTRPGSVSGRFTATNSTRTATRSWCKMGKTFSPPLDLSGNRALGLWVYGDGKGEVINLQQTSPPHMSHGIADHYIVVDFVGWRYFELIEPEGKRHADYSWPYGGIYSIYRESIRPNAVETLSLWYNNLPPGGEVTCYLSPIRALPTVKATLRNPRVSIGGVTLTFPVEIETGQVLEFRSPADCRLFGPQGEELAQVTPLGDVPMLTAGTNEVRFECDATDELTPRAYVSVISRGEPVRGKAPDDQIDWSLLRREDDPPRTVRRIDGKQNQWETVCRASPPQATVEVEIAIDAIGESGALYSHPDALTLVASDSLEAFADTPRNEYAKYVVSGARKGFPKSIGVTHDLALSDEVAKGGKSTLCYQATSTREGGWSARGKRFDPPLDLSGYTQVGFPIHGDGNGEILYLQLRDTKGAWYDMKIGVGFKGWKYREFALTGAACDLANIEYLIVYYNALPAEKTCVCYLADVRALRDPRALRDATFTVGGGELVFPGLLQPGERLVYRTHDDCVIYGLDGKQRARVEPRGKSPILTAGRNRVRLEFAGDVPQPFRATVKIVKVYGR